MADLVSPLLDPRAGFSEKDRALVDRLTRAEAALIAGLPSDDPNDPKRRRRVAATATELAEQPDCIAQTLKRNAAAVGTVVADVAASRPARIVLTGCGDSLACHIGMRQVWETATGLPAIPVQALELAYYPGSLVDDLTLVIGLSSSGETPRTVEALLAARQAGAKTLALTNSEKSSITSVADHTLMVSAKRVGWPTQASTAAMALQVQLADAFAKVMQRPGPLDPLAPGDVEGAVSDALEASKGADEVGRTLSGTPILHFTAAGPAYASALFGAAKVRECSSGHAIAHRLEEVHHYTSVKPGETMIVIAPPGPSRARAADTARQIRAWDGRSIGIIDAADTALATPFDHVIAMPPVAEALSPFTYTIPVQRLAVAMALTEFERADHDP
ncbi:MAG: SIS domain-containing protein [Pseudomonadota bacterium]